MLSAFCYTIRPVHHAMHALTVQHTGDSKEGWGVAEDHLRSTAPMCFQVSAINNSQLYQCGYCNNFHREITTAREGFTNKLTKFSKHIPRLSFSHELKWKHLWYHSKLSLE